MTLRRAWPFLTIGAILACAAAWQTAQQSYDQDVKYQQLSDSISGGDSYPEIAPQPVAANGSVGLVIYNRGHSTLTGVTVTIWPPGNFDPSTWEVFDVGILPSIDNFNMGRRLTSTITPKFDETAIIADGEKVSSFQFLMTAQNGLTMQTIQFKKGKCLPLAYRYWVTKAKWASKDKVLQPGTIEQTMMDKTEWLDGRCQ